MSGAAGPTDPITALAEGAATMHELWRAYVDAGFTEPQALYLVGCLLRGATDPAPDA